MTDEGKDGSGSSHNTTSGFAKRKISTTACIPCRQRKTKCNGARPFCDSCAAHKTNAQCEYKPFVDKRRRYSGSHVHELVQRVTDLEGVIVRIQKGGEADVMAAANESWQVESPRPSADGVHWKGEQDNPVEWSREDEDLTLDKEGTVRYFGATSNLAHIQPTIPSPVFLDPSISSPGTGRGFSTVRNYSESVINHLLDLYWSWQHPYFTILDKDLFLRDLRSGGKFFSAFLLKAILLHASHLSDHPDLRSDPSDASTAGYQFFNEMKGDLDVEIERSNITTIQALILLASRDAGIGMQSRGWIYSGMAFRMALDLGLHLDCKSLADCGLLSDEEIHVRRITFWGCYLFDQGWSAYLGRPSLIPQSEITTPQPKSAPEKATLWYPVWNMNSGKRLSLAVESYPGTTFASIIALVKIIEAIVTSLYKTNLFTNKTGTLQQIVMRHFLALMQWKNELPLVLQDTPQCSAPSVLIMHALSHTAQILLFRPFLRTDRCKLDMGSLPTPAFQCAYSVSATVRLLERYRELYSLRLIVNLATHITFTAATIPLAASDRTQNQSKELERCIDYLREIGESWPSAKAVRDGILNRISYSEARQVKRLSDSGINDFNEMENQDILDTDVSFWMPGIENWDFINSSFDTIPNDQAL